MSDTRYGSKNFVGYRLHFYDPYVWKVILSNLFINSIVSNQANPCVPQEALLYTLRESPLGIVSTLVYVALGSLVLYRIAKLFKTDLAGMSRFRGLLERKEIHLVAFCLSWVFITLKLNPPGAFLYSMTIVPLIIILICRFLDLRRRFDRVLLYTTVALVIINNANQIMKFREALSVLSS